VPTILIAIVNRGGWLIWPVLAFLLVAFPLSIIRYRKRGPALGWVPRKWRSKTNSWYTRHGWEAPYDADGNKLPGRW
jgi:hypothetical protein